VPANIVEAVRKKETDVTCYEKIGKFLFKNNGYLHERTILLKYLKVQLDTDLKIILLDHKNNYVGYAQAG